MLKLYFCERNTTSFLLFFRDIKMGLNSKIVIDFERDIISCALKNYNNLKI